MLKNLLLFSFIFICFGCKNDTKKAAPAVAPAPVAQEVLLPLTNDFATNILSPVDYVDIVLYNHGFSMNISQPNSIQSLFSGMTGEAKIPAANCPSQGRIFFNSKGKMMTEADLHFIPNQCAILVFHIDGKRKYASQLNETGIKYF